MPETLFLAVSFLDRFLSVEVTSRNSLQLAGITCVLVAAKYEEIYAPSVRAWNCWALLGARSVRLAMMPDAELLSCGRLRAARSRLRQHLSLSECTFVVPCRWGQPQVFTLWGLCCCC